MIKDFKLSQDIEKIIQFALAEDLGEWGDLTSNLLLTPSERGRGIIIAKEEGIIAGLSVAQKVFEKVDAKIKFSNFVNEGEKVSVSDTVAKIEGAVRSILTAERTALNFLQKLSGIATMTSQFVEQIKGTKAKILDTRKTTPGLRSLEKYAIRLGGGKNHRMGLYDMILIKENHIKASGGLTTAVKRILENMQAQTLNLSIEVEARNLEEVKEALELRVDRIMLDNMTLSQIQKAVDLVDGRIELEVSGGVSLKSVRKLAETGVDFISVGALTHSAKAMDLTLLIV